MTSHFTGRTIAVILLSTGLIFVGNGMFQTMLPMRAEREGFSTGLIGFLGSAYFAGFIAGCVIGPPLIRAVGHIRAYAGIVAILAAIVLLFPVWVAALPWLALRFLTGICLAIAVMVVESWLNDQTTNAMRGRILSVYIIVTNVGWISGQLGVNLADLLGATLFILVAVAVCLSVAPVALTPTREPEPVPRAGLDIRALFGLSPVGTIGCFLVGMIEGAFWTLGPLFGQLRGFGVFEITLLMGVFVLGGTLTQWPIGLLSDRFDRRLVILPVVIATAISGLALASVEEVGLWAMLALGLAHGGLMIPIYSLCVAHVNDGAAADRFVQVSGGLLLIYSIGAALGPVLAAPLMDRLGAGWLFVFISIVLGCFAAVVLWRLGVARRRILPHRGRFAPVPRTTQSIYEFESPLVGDERGRDGTP
ncbi:MFS transporter [Limibaculum sp. M0105]|uniref:MFS transporter n=1 Tax=Thermohalobaculum xanthum TaxID=2753746 RepID=A0A8J7SD21_9RHOB|nr:MFS transporter [Thermohalobaculum xanthum]MBK0398172.1 MFS transporter [Thermohalobaculum xanthum]